MHKNTTKLILLLTLTSQLFSSTSLKTWVDKTKLSGDVSYSTQELQDDTNTTNKEIIETNIKLSTFIDKDVLLNIKYKSFQETQNSHTTTLSKLDQLNFLFLNEKSTYTIGTQKAQSVFLSNEEDTTSSGITALYPIWSLGFVGGYYTNTYLNDINNTTLSDDIKVIGLLWENDTFKTNIWYAKVDKLEATNISLRLTLNHTEFSTMSTKIKDEDITTGIDAITLKQYFNKSYIYASYGISQKDGGTVSFDNNSDAKGDIKLEYLTLSNYSDATATILASKMVFDTSNFSIGYLKGESDTLKFKETSFNYQFELIKNLKGEIVYSNGDIDDENSFELAKFELKYKF